MGKYVFKVFGSHLIAVLIVVFMTPLLFFVKDSQLYQTAISVVLIAFYWVVMCLALEKSASNDIKTGQYSLWKPAAAATVLNAVNMLLIMLDIAMTSTVGVHDEMALYVFRYFNAGYAGFLMNNGDAVWMRFMVVVLTYGVVFLAYIRAGMMKKKNDRFLEQLKKDMDGVPRAVDLPPEE